MHIKHSSRGPCPLPWVQCQVLQMSIAPQHFTKKQLIQSMASFTSGRATWIPMFTPHSSFNQSSVMRTLPCPHQRKTSFFVLTGLANFFRVSIFYEKTPPILSSVQNTFRIVLWTTYTFARQCYGHSSTKPHLTSHLTTFLRWGQQLQLQQCMTTKRGSTISMNLLLRCSGRTTTERRY